MPAVCSSFSTLAKCSYNIIEMKCKTFQMEKIFVSIKDSNMFSGKGFGKQLSRGRPLFGT